MSIDLQAAIQNIVKDEQQSSPIVPETSSLEESSSTAPTKGLYVKTFGCQMNVHDSQKIFTLMAKKGFSPVEEPSQADVILVNTCSVREKPEQKVMSAVGQYAVLKKKNPDLIVGVGGCFARQEGQNLIDRAPAIDLVFGPDNIPELPKMIHELEADAHSLVEVDFDPKDNVRFLDIAPKVLPSKHAAMVTIMKGCDKYCSFCIVPHVRGRERYRPAQEILNEVRRLVDSGIYEVLLLGQSVTSYRWQDGDEIWELSRLLRAIDQVEGLRRLRFTSPYPRDFGPDLIDCFGSLDTLCEQVHLPFQSGSNRILYRMNRRHTREQYFAWVDALRVRCPDIALSSDVIVGFPGEEEIDFEETMDLINRVRFDQLYSYMYSPRPKTPAARKMQVSDEDKKRRLLILQARQKEIMRERNEALEGTIQEVMVEGPSRNDPTWMKGRTRTHKVVNFPASPELIGRFVHVKIQKGFPHSLAGELVPEQ
mgnify:CR=1 FL=1